MARRLYQAGIFALGILRTGGAPRTLAEKMLVLTGAVLARDMKNTYDTEVPADVY